MRDAWANARVRKNVSLIHTYHGFKGNKQRAIEFLKLIFRAFCLCWDHQTQDLHVDWILFRGRALIPVSSEVAYYILDEILIAGELQESSKKTVCTINRCTGFLS